MSRILKRIAAGVVIAGVAALLLAGGGGGGRRRRAATPRQPARPGRHRPVRGPIHSAC